MFLSTFENVKISQKYFESHFKITARSFHLLRNIEIISSVVVKHLRILRNVFRTMFFSMLHVLILDECFLNYFHKQLQFVFSTRGDHIVNRDKNHLGGEFRSDCVREWNSCYDVTKSEHAWNRSIRNYLENDNERGCEKTLLSDIGVVN